MCTLQSMIRFKNNDTKYVIDPVVNNVTLYDSHKLCVIGCVGSGTLVGFHGFEFGNITRKDCEELPSGWSILIRKDSGVELKCNDDDFNYIRETLDTADKDHLTAIQTSLNAAQSLWPPELVEVLKEHEQLYSKL